MSNPESTCPSGFLVDRSMSTAILGAIKTGRSGGNLHDGQSDKFFRLAVPSEHEVRQRQARHCAMAIMADVCPNFSYDPTAHGYEITQRI